MTTNDAKSLQTAARIGAAAGVTLIGGTMVLGGTPVSAATFTVTNLDDAGAGSLRDALASADAAPGPDVIDFQPGLTGTIVLATGQLVISSPLDIVGPGSDVIAVSGNSASRVIYRTPSYEATVVTVSGLTLTDGAAVDGGGLKALGAIALDDVVITGNAATSRGGGVLFDAPGQLGALTITDSVISNNTTDGDGGGIYIEDTLATTTPGAPFLLRSAVTGNTAAGDGGGVAIYDPDSPLSIVESVISGNSAGGNGGGLYVYSFDGEFGLTIEGTTISGNTAAGSGGGAAIYDAPVTFRNSTVSGNTAGANGGGVYAYRVGATLEHSTVAGNTATGSGGGVSSNSESYYSVSTLFHTIVADNTAGSDADVLGDVAAAFSLIEIAPLGTFTDNGGNLVDVDPLLGALQDNGGPTETQLPGTGSVAIGAGDPAIAAPPATDQRGFARVIDVIDIGAVEVDGGTVSISPAVVSVAESAGTVAITVTRSGTSDGAASVDVTSADATATAGADYTSVAQTVTWASGESGPKVVNIPILTDDAIEADELFTVVLTNPVGVTIVDATSAVTITDVPPATTSTTSSTLPPTTTSLPPTTAPAPTTTLAATPPTLAPVLPSTGGSQNNTVMALLAGVLVAAGGLVSSLARRRPR